MTNSKQPVSINGLEFDALIAQDNTLEATITEYPVEEGFSVSDSVILSPEKLNMTLFVTNTPVTWAGRHGTSTSRTLSVVERLREIYFARLPVTIITTEATYVNMAIASITISKSVELGTSREIPISFQKVNITKTEKTTIPESYGKSGATKTQNGTASTSSASSTSSSSSKSSGSSSNSGDKKEKGSILYNAGKSLGLLG